jgi:hypothetical protein
MVEFLELLDSFRQRPPLGDQLQNDALPGLPSVRDGTM